MNGVNLQTFAGYDVLVADSILIGTQFDVQGIALWRVIQDPSDPTRQILQVAAPEPASVVLWSLIGVVGVVWVARWRRTARR